MASDGSANWVAYVWAGIALVALNLAFILGVLIIRPNTDPVVLIERLVEITAPTGAALASFIKAHQTAQIVKELARKTAEPGGIDDEHTAP